MKSLAAQLCLRLLVGGGLLLGVMGSFLQWRLTKALTSEFDTALRDETQSLATLAEQDEAGIAMDFAGENMPQFENPKGAEIFLLATDDGHEVARSRSLGSASLPIHAGSLGVPHIFEFTLPDGRPFRCASLGFTPQNEDENEGRKPKGSSPKLGALLLVGRDKAPLNSTLSALRSSVLLAVASALASLAAVVYLGVRSGLQPLRLLGRDVSAVTAASLSIQLPVASLSKELQPISSSLNQLLARLQSAFERERRFSSTAAHEFRTPLAELRAVAEVNMTIPATESERSQSWRDVLAATGRMESLAACLLDLTRSEDSATAIEKQPVSVAEAIAAAWRPWASRASERNLRFDMEADPGLEIQTNPSLLHAILGNLCSNAAEYAPGGSAIAVRVEESAACTRLLFSNPAGSLSDSDVAHLFEKFWRKDSARQNGSHHGLGLALAADLSTLLGGSLSARLTAERDLEFTLWLPNPESIESVSHQNASYS